MTRLDRLPANYRLCPKCDRAVRWDLSLGHREGCDGQPETPGGLPHPPADSTFRGSPVSVDPAQCSPPETPTETGVWTVFVYGPPVGYKRVGGEFTRTTADGPRRFRALDPRVRAQRKAIRDAAKDVVPCMAFTDGPVALEVDVYHTQPGNGRVWPDARNWGDADNFGKLAADSIGWDDRDQWGVYRDDGQTVDLTVRKRFGSTARTVLRLSRPEPST